MDIDRVLHHFTMSLWRTFGALISSRFVFLVTCFGCVEDVEEIEDFIVFEVLSVCEELDVFFDGVITFSLVELACPYLQTR